MTLMITKVPMTANATVNTTAMSWLTSWLALPSMRPGKRADRGDREDARRDGAPHAAHAVDREDVERVVDCRRSRRSVGAEAEAAGHEADDEGATDAHEAGRRGDGHEAGDGAAAAPTTLTLRPRR